MASLWAIGLSACQTDAVFGCDDDEQCRQDSALGRCEVNGFCSFSDETCPSGRRYSELAGDGLGGLCVLEETTSGPGPSTGGDGSTSTGPGATTVEPMVTSGDDTSTSTSDSDASSTSGTPVDVPTDGLVLWLSFDAGIGDGGMVVDDSDNGMPGRCVGDGCPTATPGPVGMALRFDGVDDRVEVADHPKLRFETGMSVSLWATSDGLPGTSIVFGKPFEGNDRNSYEMYLSSGRLQHLRWSMDADEGLEGNVFIPTPFTNPDTWFHLVGTWDGNTLIFYVDGEEVGQRPQVSTAYDEHPVTIGGDLIDFTPAHFWTGAVDEVRMYDRPLAPDEVQALYQQGAK